MDYKFKLVDFSDLEIQHKVVSLQNIVYSHRKKHFSEESMSFWYLDNPIGRVISFNAFLGDQIVAHYACIPIKMKIDGIIRLGLLDMATVTHPEHRGKGLFKRLATLTYDYAKKQGYEFVVGVANANSFPGYMKYFDFTFVSQLDVKVGVGKILTSTEEKTFSCFWSSDTFKWRTNQSHYRLKRNNVYSVYKHIPCIRLFMGQFDKSLIGELNMKKKRFAPFNIYIGLGADLSKGYYFSLPKFIKHSPFSLIFLDLTEGKLPKPNKDNIFFQLMDFDVA